MQKFKVSCSDHCLCTFAQSHVQQPNMKWWWHGGTKKLTHTTNILFDMRKEKNKTESFINDKFFSSFLLFYLHKWLWYAYVFAMLACTHIKIRFVYGHEFNAQTNVSERKNAERASDRAKAENLCAQKRELHEAKNKNDLQIREGTLNDLDGFFSHTYICSNILCAHLPLNCLSISFSFCISFFAALQTREIIMLVNVIQGVIVSHICHRLLSFFCIHYRRCRLRFVSLNILCWDLYAHSLLIIHSIS